MISVYTPSNDTTFLFDAYCSLLAQTYSNWEWHILLNGDAVGNPRSFIDDSRVHFHRSKTTGSVGQLKAEAITYCTGDILFELDHDDILTDNCLEEVLRAFNTSDAVLVYGNTAQIKADGSSDPEEWSPHHGWTYDNVMVSAAGTKRLVHMAHTPDPLPSNISYIWYAPNHPRVYLRSAYEAVGGYNPERIIADDQELCMRMFIQGSFEHIDKCLYLQRTGTGRNTQKDPDLNPKIQTSTLELYFKYVRDVYTAWSEREGLEVVVLEPGINPAVSLEREHSPRLGTNTNTVGLIVAEYCLQYLPPTKRVAFFESVHRVLAHDGMISTLTPSTDGRAAWQKGDEASYWNENSFWYYTNPDLCKELGFTGKLQGTALRTIAPNSWAQQQNLLLVRADIVARKDGPDIAGLSLHRDLPTEVPDKYKRQEPKA